MAATPHRVPVLKMIAGSISIGWRNRARYSAGIALPTLLLVCIGGMWLTFWPEVEGLAAWAVWTSYMAGFAIFAVTCHRLVLMPEAQTAFRISLTLRELKFLGWVIAMYAAYFALMFFPLTIAVNLPLIADVIQTPDGFYYTRVILSAPVMYILARLCLVFPATAIDMNRGLKWSWDKTRGNGWRMAIIFGFYPWLISTAIWLLSRDEPAMVEWALTALLYYIGLAVQVFAVSLTYKEVVAFGEPAASS